MKDIITNLSKSIAIEIISRPNFILDEVSNIIKVRIKDSLMDILLENVQKEEANYLKLLMQQSNHKVGSKKYNELAYQLTFAKHKKAIANRALHNEKRKTKLSNAIDFVKAKYEDLDIDALYKMLDDMEGGNNG